MKAKTIDRLAIAVFVLAGFITATSMAQDSVTQSTPAELGVADAVTSEELEETNGSDPVTGLLPIQPTDARGPDISFKPLGTAPRSVLIRIVPTATTTAN